MIDIKIKKYRIQSYKYGIVLSEIAEKGEEAKNPGEKYLTNKKYFGNLERTTDYMLEQEIVKDECYTIDELNKSLKQAKKELKMEIRELKEEDND